MAVGQRFPDSSSSDTINSSIVPIVVVPGVMGSRLDIPGGSDWDPDYAPSMAGWLACSTRAGRQDLSVTLKPNVTIVRKLSSYAYTPGSMDAKSEIDGDDELATVASLAGHKGTASDLYEKRGWGGLAWGFYGSILQYLERTFNHPDYHPNGKHPVYGFGYDWRKSNASSAQNLVTRVHTILSQHKGADQVILVTHSMGGLVARYACMELGLAGKVKGVIHVVQPSNGAVVCYRRFATGCDAEVEPGGSNPLNTILGDAWWKYTAYMSGLSGPTQLLPNARYSMNFEPGCSTPQWLENTGGPTLDLTSIYDLYGRPTFPGILRSKDDLPDFGYQIAFIEGIWNSQILPELKRRIDGARKFHATLGASAHSSTYVIYTNGEYTDEKVEWQDQYMAHLQSYTGDGTVPSISAGCFDLTGVVRRTAFRGEDNLQHSDVFKNASIRGKVREHINEILVP